jgi:hypothetical protein
VNSWIISYHIEEVRRSEEEIVSSYNLLLQRRLGHPQRIWRRANDRASLWNSNAPL